VRFRQVPALPTWLLRRCVSRGQREALLGDLFEEYQAGRSPGWYWRETLIALLLSIRRDACRLFFHRGAQFILALVAQSLLILYVWVAALAQPFRQHCPAWPIPLSGSTVPLLGAAMAQIAIVLAVWLGAPRRPLNPRSRLFRLAVAAFAAIGLGGGALTWAGTASCPMGHSARLGGAHATPAWSARR
jgi:hypothetical protein